jgi:hypothetical protein
MHRSVAMSLFSLCLAVGSFACSGGGSPSAAADDAPADDQAEEQDLATGATRLASKLQSPDHLTVQGDNAYFATNYGFATQEEAEFHHDIWIKSKDGRAKRLYKNLWGASWAMVATKNGIYEINEGFASVVRYPLDGSKPDGESLVHAIFGHEELPEVGVIQLAADDDGFVVALRTDDGDTAPGPIMAYTPAGKSEKKLGSIPGGATALTVAGSTVYVGTRAGDVLSAARDGTGSLKKIASGEGAIASIAVAGDATFFGTDKGLFVLRKGAKTAERLLPEGAAELLPVRDSLLFTQFGKGVSSVPLAGGAPHLVFKTKSPSDVVLSNGSLIVSDTSLGACRQTDEGQACAFDGAVYRVKF